MMNLTKEQESYIVETLCDMSDDDMYDEMLNSIYGQVTICGNKYDTSEALKHVDPVAYRCGRADYFGNDDMFYEIDGSYYLVDEINDALAQMEANND